MYTAELITPNPIRFPDQPTEGFSAAAQRTESVDDIQRLVRDSLHYPERPEDWLGGIGVNSLEAMVADQQTDCVGYTMAGSELLSRSGIEHYVVYGRKHFLLLLPETSNDTTRLHTRDMLLPEFNGDVTDRIRYGTPASIALALSVEPERQHNVALDTKIFAEWNDLTPRQLAARYRQLWGREDAAHDIHNTCYDLDDKLRESKLNERRFNERFSWILSVYTPETGREVMANYAGIIHATTVGNIALALSHTEQLAGRFPENNCRSRHDTIRSLVGQMCLDGQHRGSVGDVIEAYCSSIRTGDPRVSFLRADLYRLAANTTGDAQAAAQAASAAASAYKTASHASKIANFKNAALNKSYKLANRVI